MEALNEFFWGGYLTFLVDEGMVTAVTPREEVLKIKAEFMAELRGEHSPVTDIGENE